MRGSLIASVIGCSAFAFAIPHDLRAAESTTASIVITAQFSSRTSLKVSSQLLHFDVSDPDRAALAVIDFSAAARTRQAGEVVLTVEGIGSLDGPGGAADVETSLTFSGEGAGVVPGDLHGTAPSVAGRWIGSGLRTGRLTFALRASAAGTYSLPVRFVLSAP
jgi:hypothetical protein